MKECFSSLLKFKIENEKFFEMNRLHRYPTPHMLKPFLFASAALGFASAVCAQKPASVPETHSFQIKGEVHYRCFGGNPPKSRDSRTQVACDNKDQHKVLFNERVNVQIKQEPSPDNDPTLTGGLTRTATYQGRTFTMGMSLFKDLEAGQPAVYRLRTVAQDDEPRNPRQSEWISRASAVKSLNPLTVQYLSVGQPEEIVFSVSIAPTP